MITRTFLGRSVRPSAIASRIIVRLQLGLGAVGASTRSWLIAGTQPYNRARPRPSADRWIERPPVSFDRGMARAGPRARISRLAHPHRRPRAAGPSPAHREPA